MAIRATCQQCGTHYSLKEDLAGRKIRCNRCQAAVRVPTAPTPTAATRPEPEVPAKAPAGKSPRPGGSSRPPRSKTTYATECPACGKPVPRTSATCPKCGFNAKLGRRMALSDAIKEADNQESGAAGATRAALREEKGDQRVEAGRKVWYGTIAAVLLFFGILALGILWTVHSSWWGPSLEEKALRVGVPRRVVESRRVPSPGPCMHPYCIGMRIEMTIDKSKVRIQQIVPPAGTEGPAAWTQFAQTMQLPLYVRARFPEALVRRVLLEELPAIQGSYTPKKLEAGINAPEEGLYVYRDAPQPNENGFLTGFLFDVGSEHNAFGKEMMRPGRRMEIHGTLYFIASREKDLWDSPYAQALRSELERVPEPGIAPSVPEADAEGTDNYFFHPVVQVSRYTTVR